MRRLRELRDGPVIEFVPLPSRSQFLDVIESAFSAMTLRGNPAFQLLI